jgi:phage-related protein
MSYFEFAGMSTASIPGLLIEAKNIHDLPERDVEKIHVPGRNGDVLVDSGSYQNATVSYQCAVTKFSALPELARLLTVGQQAGWGFTPWRGYQLLRDGWAGHERLAVHSSQIPMEEIIANRLLRFTVAFDCKPQKYYNRAAVVTRSGAGSLTLNRPVGATASTPRIEIVGSGTVTLTLEGQTITLTGLVTPPQSGGEYQWPSAVIDSEAMIACRTSAAGVRANIDIAQWPQFWQLVHTVSATGGVTSIKIYPRWWSL